MEYITYYFYRGRTSFSPGRDEHRGKKVGEKRVITPFLIERKKEGGLLTALP